MVFSKTLGDVNAVISLNLLLQIVVTLGKENQTNQKNPPKKNTTPHHQKALCFESSQIYSSIE